MELESQEIESLFAVPRIEAAEELKQLVFPPVRAPLGGLHRLTEEFTNIHPENGQNPEQGVEADLVFSGLHPAQIRLLDPDLRGQLGLGEAPGRAGREGR